MVSISLLTSILDHTESNLLYQDDIMHLRSNEHELTQDLIVMSTRVHHLLIVLRLVQMNQISRSMHEYSSQILHDVPSTVDEVTITSVEMVKSILLANNVMTVIRSTEMAVVVVVGLILVRVITVVVSTQELIL